jgi:hypothetical protein
MRRKKAAAVVTPDAELARWCKVLEQGKTVAEVVPPGWKTIRQLAEARGRGDCSTLQIIHRLMDENKVERRNFTVKLRVHTRPVPHYRLK